MTPRSLAVLFLVFFSWVACDRRSAPTAPTLSPPEPVAAPFVRVSGRVLDYARRVPVGNLQLEWRSVGGLAPGEPDGLRTAVTDDAGSYALSLPAADHYQVSVPPGSGSIGGTVIVPTKSYQTDFLINPGKCVLTYGFIFEAVARMPVAGAQVSWAGERATSAADGSYRVELGCDRTFGFGTTAFVVSHPSYATFFGLGTRAEFLSNGGSFRRDVDLTPLGR